MRKPKRPRRNPQPVEARIMMQSSVRGVFVFVFVFVFVCLALQACSSLTTDAIQDFLKYALVSRGRALPMIELFKKRTKNRLASLPRLPKKDSFTSFP